MEPKDKYPKDLTLLTRPYTFVLKEGHTIKHDLLDYSLTLWTGKPEFLTNNSKKNLTVKTVD